MAYLRVCSLLKTVSHLAQAAVQLAVHSGPAVSHSGSLVCPSQCWVPDVQHMHVSASFSTSLCLQILLIQILILIFKCFIIFLYVGMWRWVEVILFCILLHWAPELTDEAGLAGKWAVRICLSMSLSHGVSLCATMPSFSRVLECWTHVLLFVC